MSVFRSISDPQIQGLLKNSSQSYHSSPVNWNDQVIYFLLPDRFSDNKENKFLDIDNKLVTTGQTPPFTPSDANDAIQNAQDNSAWLDAGAKFCGGNIAGLTSKLGYLKRLGITAIWVGPLFKQVAKLETYHGYGIQDFLALDPRFGTRDEFKAFVAAAHQMGIYVVMDIIMNHCGNVWAYKNGNPTFNNKQKYPVEGYYDADRKVTIPFGTVNEKLFPQAFPDGAIWPKELQDPSCFHQEGYIQNWEAPDEFIEGDFFDLKDFNLGQGSADNYSPSKALITLTEVYKYWMAYLDIDGYRLDTVKHMGDGATRFFSRGVHEFAERLGKNNFMLVGEIAGGDIYFERGTTGLDAALGLGNIMPMIWNLPQGHANPADYFGLFRNEEYDNPSSKLWLANELFTMIDDHDQVWIGPNKARFCSTSVGPKLVMAALAFNLCTLGIPCVYYGTEQSFDGSGGEGSPGHGSDQYIREAMFGGGYGPFRSRNAHCFNEKTDVYVQFSMLAGVRSQELALRRGRQFLREISGDGQGWGYPFIEGDRMRSIVAWARINDNVEILCAINTDDKESRTAWVTVDGSIQNEGKTMVCLCPPNVASLKVENKGGRLSVSMTLPPGGFALFK